MKLNKLIKLKNTDNLIKIRILIEYFDLAKSSYDTYREYLQKWLKHDTKELKLKSIASMCGLYSSGRICFLITRSINEQIKTTEMQTIRNDYEKWANNFINFRNDFGAHPLNKEAGYFSRIASFGNEKPQLEIETRNIETYDVVKCYNLCPKEDIEKLYEYLDKLSGIYKKEWKSIL